jgi:fluoroacetyl-CoA thioesterase
VRDDASREDRRSTVGRCDPGLRYERSLVVGPDDTALALGSGDVPVLGTPAVLALAEGACVDAIADDLPDGETSVGTWAELEHLKATPVGRTVTAHATLIGHHGRRLEFLVTVDEDGETIAKVKHRRILLDRERFLGRVAATAGTPAADAPEPAPADATPEPSTETAVDLDHGGPGVQAP